MISKKLILTAALGAVLVMSTLGLSQDFAQAQQLKRKGGTIQSMQDPGMGHESHQLAILLPPKDGKMYSGTLYFYATEPVQVVTLKGPLKPGVQKGGQIWTTDGQTKYALSMFKKGLSGKHEFEANALAVHTMRDQPFTVSYTVQYTEEIAKKSAEVFKGTKDKEGKQKSVLEVRPMIKDKRIFERPQSPGMFAVIFKVCSGSVPLTSPELVVSSDKASRSVNLVTKIGADTCQTTSTTIKAKDGSSVKVSLVGHSDLSMQLNSLKEKMDGIEQQIREQHSMLKQLRTDEGTATQNKEKEGSIAMKIRELRLEYGQLNSQYYKLLFERHVESKPPKEIPGTMTK